MGSAILIHKTPAIWESECARSTSAEIKLSNDFLEISDLSDSEVKFLSSLPEDIFFLLTQSISEYLGIDKIHIILCHDSNEIRNWEVIERNGVIRSFGDFVFWSSDSMHFLPDIDDAEVLVVRGNYPNFHNKLMEIYTPKTTIFYPATSLFFPHFGEKMSKWITKLMDGSIKREEMIEVLNRLLGESVFSKLTEPDMGEMNSRKEELEARQSLRNYCLNCIKIATRLRTRESPGKYPVVLYDEPSNFQDLRKKYPNSSLMKISKPSSPIFDLDLQTPRDIDIIFTGTTIQKTKNIELFFQIVEEIFQIRPETKFAVVGYEKETSLIKSRFPEVNIEFFGRISKKELCNLFNRSRTHVITSGRDCFPRTIPESMICGCFNIALDILSDGLSIIRENPVLGRVIDTSNCIPILEPGYNISVLSTGSHIGEQITEALESDFNHLSISTLCRHLMPIEEMVQLDKIWEEIDLNNIN